RTQTGRQAAGRVHPRAGFGVPAAPVPSLTRRLLVSDHHGAMSAARLGETRRFEHGGFEGGDIRDRLPPALAHKLDVKGHQSSSRRKLMSTAGAECVMAP